MFFKCPHCGKRYFLPSTRNECERTHIAYHRQQMEQVVYADNYPGRRLNTERLRSASQRPDLRQARSRARASDSLLDPMNSVGPFNPMHSMGGSETAGHSHRSDPKPDCESRNYDPSPSYQDNDSGGCGDSGGD